MYHRFNESKYPSTNIQMDVFENHIETIKSSGFTFLNAKTLPDIYFEEKLDKNFYYQSTMVIFRFIIMLGLI